MILLQFLLTLIFLLFFIVFLLATVLLIFSNVKIKSFSYVPYIRYGSYALTSIFLALLFRSEWLLLSFPVIWFASYTIRMNLQLKTSTMQSGKIGEIVERYLSDSATDEDVNQFINEKSETRQPTHFMVAVDVLSKDTNQFKLKIFLPVFVLNFLISLPLLAVGWWLDNRRSVEKKNKAPISLKDIQKILNAVKSLTGDDKSINVNIYVKDGKDKITVDLGFM